MDYNLLSAQKDFLNIPHSYSLDVALYMGGFGAGKTFVGSLLGIILALKYPGIRGLVGAQTFPLVRDTTLQSYFEHLDKMGLKNESDYWYKTGEGKFIFSNGSEILFRHLEEPNKLKSLNLGFVELEEMSDTSESTFKMLLSRLRQEKKNNWDDAFRYRLFGHTNPEQSKGWIYKHFVEQNKPNYRLVQAPTTQNTYLPKHYVDELKAAYDPEYYRINVLGEFGDYTSGLIVKNFNPDLNIKDCNYIDNIPLHISCDFNVDPMCWALSHITADKVFFFDELVIENTCTEQCVKELLRRYPNHKADIIINGDASGDYRSTQSEISNYIIMQKAIKKHYPNRDVKIQIRRFNPQIVARISAFNRLVCDANNNRRLIVNKKCEKLLYNIFNLKYKPGTAIIDLPTTSQLKTDRELKFLGHIFDAASYPIEFYFPISKQE